jgi:hypothetical protein
MDWIGLSGHCYDPSIIIGTACSTARVVSGCPTYHFTIIMPLFTIRSIKATMSIISRVLNFFPNSVIRRNDVWTPAFAGVTVRSRFSKISFHER